MVSIFVRVRVDGKLIAYSGDFTPASAPKCKEIALRHIAQGAQAVFQVAGGCGLGALDAAKEKKKWGIGVDADQSYLGKQVLTSALKRVDTSVYSTIQQVLNNKFAGGTNAVFSLSNNGVGLGKISPQVPKADIQKVLEIAKQIAAGKITGIPTTVLAGTYQLLFSYGGETAQIATVTVHD